MTRLAFLALFCLEFVCSCQKTSETQANQKPAVVSESNKQQPPDTTQVKSDESSNKPTTPRAEEFPTGNQNLPKPIARTLPESFRCGEHQCMRFSSAREVLVPLLLREKPRVIGFGEAHAPATFHGETTVSRFTQQIFPTFSDGTSYLLIEILAPPATGCEREKKEAQKESDVITEGQSKNNQNEYLQLGSLAREQGVVPDILRASCDDMKRIASKDGGVLAYMETIGRLFARDITARLAQTKKGRPFVIGYGGALHNDAEPRSGRESWSYGPAISTKADGAYLEIDLVIPELIQDTESWRSFPWYDDYQAMADKSGTLLMQWGTHSYSLFFPQAQTP